MYHTLQGLRGGKVQNLLNLPMARQEGKNLPNLFKGSPGRKVPSPKSSLGHEAKSPKGIHTHTHTNTTQKICVYRFVYI